MATRDDCPTCGRFLCDCVPAWETAPAKEARPCAAFQQGSDPEVCACGWLRQYHGQGGHL